MDWKQNLDPVIKDYLNSLLKEVEKYREAYLKGENVAHSQIWVALALLYRKILSIEAELNKIEEILNSKNMDIQKIIEDSLKKI